MKGRGRVKSFAVLLPRSPKASSRRERAPARSRGQRWRSHPKDLAAGGERRILEWTTPMGCCEFPPWFWGPSQVPEQPAIHSSITDMMGFGHSPAGSSGIPATPSKRATALVERASPCPPLTRPCELRDSGPRVSEPVVDESQELPGHGHACLVFAPALGDAQVVGPLLLVGLRPLVADRLDRPPANKG
jgi:hypothetical protein